MCRAGVGADRRQDRLVRILSTLKRSHPDARCALRHSSALELLVATILSAQCTDARVNQVTRKLFRRFPTAHDYAKADLGDLRRRIRSAGFFRAKARNLKEAARILVRRHSGRVPSSMEELLELPGVARKTANVVLGTWFGKAAGIVVDTHVLRVSTRLGLTRQKDPVKIERELMLVVPRKDWVLFPHLLIWHGRRICRARRPRCEECPLRGLCPSAFHVERVHTPQTGPLSAPAEGRGREGRKDAGPVAAGERKGRIG